MNESVADSAIVQFQHVWKRIETKDDVELRLREGQACSIGFDQKKTVTRTQFHPAEVLSCNQDCREICKMRTCKQGVFFEPRNACGLGL